MTTKRKGQPPKERKKQSHGIRLYDDDYNDAIEQHGSLQKFVDWAVECNKLDKQYTQVENILCLSKVQIKVD